MHAAEVIPDLRDGIGRVGEDTEDDADGHDDEADAEDGVDLADDRVNRDKGRDEVIHQDEDEPEQQRSEHAGCTALAAQLHDQARRADRKHRAHHDEQDHGEDTHHVLHHRAKVFAGDLGDGSAVVALAHHAGEVVVHAACKDGAEGDPQEHHRPPQCALHGTKDGAKAGDVQQLNEEQLPLGHHNVVHTVIDAHSRRFAVVRAEGVVHNLTIDKVAHDQDRQTE